MYNQAAKDGTEIAILARELPLSERLGADGVNYSSLEFEPLGSAAAVSWVWPSASDSIVKSLDDLAGYRDATGENFKLGTSGKGAGSYTMSLLLQSAGYPVELITGYEASGERILGVVRGELDGSSESWGSSRDAIESENLNVFAKLGNIPGLEDVPDVRDALPDEIQPLVGVLATPLLSGRPFFAPPGVPEERLEILREAFRKVFDNPEAQAEAARLGREMTYTSPEEIIALYEDVLSASDEVMSMVEE
jgi:tripartite-type tricarboxylate transporter receptor subunit TctC